MQNNLNKKLAHESRTISKRLKSNNSKYTRKGCKKNKKQIKKKRTIKNIKIKQ